MVSNDQWLSLHHTFGFEHTIRIFVTGRAKMQYSASQNFLRVIGIVATEIVKGRRVQQEGTAREKSQLS